MDESSHLRRLKWPHDAISSLLDTMGKPELQALCEALGAHKSGNKDELALRVGEHAGDGKALGKYLGATAVRHRLQQLELPPASSSSTADERAAELARALKRCYAERMIVEGIPWNLKNYQEKRLEKVDLKVIKALCLQRGIKIRAKQRASTLAAKLIEWKKDPSVGYASAPPPDDEGGEEEEEEEAETKSKKRAAASCSSAPPEEDAARAPPPERHLSTSSADELQMARATSVFGRWRRPRTRRPGVKTTITTMARRPRAAASYHQRS